MKPASVNAAAVIVKAINLRDMSNPLVDLCCESSFEFGVKRRFVASPPVKGSNKCEPDANFELFSLISEVVQVARTG